MEKRSGVPETDEALAGLTDAELDREIWAAKQLEPHLGPLPQKGIPKRIYRMERLRAERLHE